MLHCPFCPVPVPVYHQHMSTKSSDEEALQFKCIYSLAQQGLRLWIQPEARTTATTLSEEVAVSIQCLWPRLYQISHTDRMGHGVDEETPQLIPQRPSDIPKLQAVTNLAVFAARLN